MFDEAIFQGEQMSSDALDESIAKRVAVRGRYGDIAYFPSDVPIGRAVGLYGEWARIETDFLCSLVGPGSTVLDIGANIGSHSIEFSKRVGLMGTVHAFEPQAAVFDLLKWNLDSNGCTNVNAALLAIADHDAEMIVPDVDYDGLLNVGSVALLSGDGLDAGARKRVRAIAVDDLKLKRCDLVKIDVEGAECLVLQGMRDTICRLQPFLYCECNTIEAGVDLFRLLPTGYLAFLVRCPAFNPNNVRSVSEDIFGHACESGLLFVPPRAAHSIGNLASSRAEVVSFGTVDELARAILATPRYGDASKSERDPVKLNAEIRALKSALSETDQRLLDLNGRHALVEQKTEQLNERCRVAERERQAAEEKANALLAERDRHADEATRLHFRVATLNKRLTTTETSLDRATGARDLAEQELYRARADLARADDEVAALAKELAGNRHELADALAQSVAQAAKLTAASDEVAALIKLLVANRNELANAPVRSPAQAAELTAAHDAPATPRAYRRRRPSWIGGLARMLNARNSFWCVKASGLFDRQWYLAVNRDVAQSGIDPLRHYLQAGAAELRDPSPGFSTARYIAANPDVAEAGFNPLVHFILHGQREGRRVVPSDMTEGDQP